MADYDLPLYLRNSASHVDHPQIIEFFVRLVRPRTFLEVGVFSSQTTMQLLPLESENGDASAKKSLALLDVLGR